MDRRVNETHLTTRTGDHHAKVVRREPGASSAADAGQASPLPLTACPASAPDSLQHAIARAHLAWARRYAPHLLEVAA